MPPVRANGAEIPALGLGTWRLEGEDCARIVAGALAQGYRHVDTAAMYGNEEAVGEGLRASGLARDEVFVTTKVWYEDIRPGDLERSAEASLKRLGLDQVDLLLIHWPNPDVPVAESVRALAEAGRRGLARHVGVSNFTAAMVDEAVAASSEPLVVNQCEYHPYLDQAKVLAACRRHGLAFTSYSPLGRGDLLADATVGAIAAAHGRSPAQVILRWHVQQAGVVAIPKSGNLERIGQNLAIGDFALTDAEMQRMHALARPEGRLVSPSFAPAWDEAA
ncbi:MAG TPA: aldo/keto reductase [Beijerinckiaceae bacterium]